MYASACANDGRRLGRCAEPRQLRNRWTGENNRFRFSGTRTRHMYRVTREEGETGTRVDAAIVNAARSANVTPAGRRRSSFPAGGITDRNRDARLPRIKYGRRLATTGNAPRTDRPARCNYVTIGRTFSSNPRTGSSFCERLRVEKKNSYPRRRRRAFSDAAAKFRREPFAYESGTVRSTDRETTAVARRLRFLKAEE